MPFKRLTLPCSSPLFCFTYALCSSPDIFCLWILLGSSLQLPQEGKLRKRRTFFFCLVTTISPGVDECLRQRKCLGLNNQRQKLQLKSFLWQYCRKHREGVGRYRKQREGGPKGCVTEVTTGYSRNSKWVWTFWERIGGQPQNNPTEGEGKLGYLLPALNSHWLMFLTGNINVSALLVHPSLYASFRRKPLGRSSQMFKWEMFNVSADYLLEG